MRIELFNYIFADGTETGAFSTTPLIICRLLGSCVSEMKYADIDSRQRKMRVWILKCIENTDIENKSGPSERRQPGPVVGTFHWQVLIKVITGSKAGFR